MQHTYRRELSLVEQAIIGPDQWRKWRSSADLIVDKESGTTSEEARHWSNCQQWFVLLINPVLHKLTRGRGRQWSSVTLKLNTHHITIYNNPYSLSITSNTPPSLTFSAIFFLSFLPIKLYNTATSLNLGFVLFVYHQIHDSITKLRHFNSTQKCL